MKRDAMPYIDFSFVPQVQLPMHARLENWGRSCNGGRSSATSPMFRQFVPARHWDVGYCREAQQPCDRVDALKLGRAVFALPEPHRLAIHWYYVQKTSVMHGRRAVACTAEMLAVYVIDARTMLINRLV